MKPEPQRSNQRREIIDCYHRVYKHGGWTVYNDERFYIEDKLKVPQDDLDMLSTQARSKKITLMDGAQRPTGISRFVLSQAAHVICFGIEADDARTLAARSSGAFSEICLDLKHHEFAWWNRITKRIWVGKLASDLKTLQGKEVQVTDTRRRRFAIA